MMTESGQVFVDSNVIIDIVGDSGEWTRWSMERVGDFVGGLLINPVIYAELCVPLTSVEEAECVVAFLGLNYLEIPKEALLLAAHAFKRYRKQGGTKTSPLPDFFIGVHAAVLGVPLLTRDVRRYRAYFPGVTLISP